MLALPLVGGRIRSGANSLLPGDGSPDFVFEMPGGFPIHQRQHRAPRYPFLATLELTDVESEKQLTAHTKDLNLYGCFAESADTFPADTKVRLRIIRSDASAACLGKVIYRRPGSGMGIQFVTIEPGSLPVLEGWLANLRE